MPAAAIRDQLRRFVDDSVLRRNTYWKLFYTFQWYNNLLSIPLLLATSLTGIGSVSQATLTTAHATPAVAWGTAAMAATSSFLAAVHRFLQYGERAEQCRNLAKAYGDLAKRIEITLDTEEDGGEVDLAAFAREVVQEMRQLVNETQDMPPSMLERERSHQTAAPRQTTDHQSHLRVSLLHPQ